MLALAQTAHIVVDVFIRVCVGSLGRTLWSWGSFGFTWVHLGSPRSRGVHSGSRGLIRAVLVVFGFIRVRVGSLWRNRCHRVHSGSRGITRPLLVIVALILVCVDSLQSA